MSINTGTIGVLGEKRHAGRKHSGALRVLVAILALAQAQQKITLYTIARRAAVVHSRVHQLLPLLRSAGLVDYEEFKGGTIRPTCRLLLFREQWPELEQCEQ